MKDKKILFLSGIDFKDKSIQVIRKTPEAYIKADWEVKYIVARDNSPKGNYYYEAEINPMGINVIRTYWPFAKLRGKFKGYFFLLLSKFSSLYVVYKLFNLGRKELKLDDYSIVYGYELQGVLALRLMKFWGLLKNKVTISRFQGTFLNEMFENKSYKRLIFNTDLMFAIKFKSNAIIMTDDGTQGDRAVQRLYKKKVDNLHFWVNGVDKADLVSSDIYEKLKADFGNKTIFLSVSRLVDWKRVDRGIHIVKFLRDMGFDDFIYLIVGDGECRKELERLVNDFGLVNNVIFVGAVSNKDVKNYLKFANYFISMYDSSNVGNPLLEAIRYNKLIVTLNNGDTSSWIKHKDNGLIYNIDNCLYINAAKDIYSLINNNEEYDRIINNLKKTEESRLWTWDQRLNAEVNLITNLL